MCRKIEAIVYYQLFIGNESLPICYRLPIFIQKIKTTGVLAARKEERSTKNSTWTLVSLWTHYLGRQIDFLQNNYCTEKNLNGISAVLSDQLYNKQSYLLINEWECLSMQAVRSMCLSSTFQRCKFDPWVVLPKIHLTNQ